MQIVPSDFCQIGTQRSVLWPSKYAKIRFRPGLCPGPRWGNSQRPLSWLERGRPSHTLPHSALTHLRCSACVPLRIPAKSTPLVNTHFTVTYVSQVLSRPTHFCRVSSLPASCIFRHFLMLLTTHTGPFCFFFGFSVFDFVHLLVVWQCTVH